jgi:hypothetical protein
MSSIDTIRISKWNIDKARTVLSGMNQVKFEDKIRFIDGYGKIVDALIGDVVVKVDMRWYAVSVNPETIKANNDVENMVDGIINNEELTSYYHFQTKEYSDKFESGMAIRANLKWSSKSYDILITPSKLQVNEYDITHETLCLELLNAGKTLGKK